MPSELSPRAPLARLLATAVLVVGTLAVRGRIAPAPPKPPTIVAVAGEAKVRARVTAAGKPVSGAQVRLFLFHDGWLPLAHATTDSGGEAVAALPTGEGGEAWVVVDAPGFARASLARVLVVPSTTDVDVALVPEHKMRVTVVDDEGQPVPTATVFVEHRGSLCASHHGGDGEVHVDAPRSTAKPAENKADTCAPPVPEGGRANGAGVVELHGISREKGIIVARAPGFDSTRSGMVAMDGALTLVLKRLSGFVVTVLGPEGKPVQDARVFVDSTTLGPARAAITGADGRIRIAGLPAGVFTLRAVKGDLVSVVDVAQELRKAEERAITLQLVPGRVVQVRVLDGEGDDAPALAGARVTLVEGGLSPFPVEAVTGREGLARVGPFLGSASVSVEADGRVPAFAEAVPENGVLTVHLVPAALLTVRVIDGRGNPVSGARLEVVGFDGRGMPFAVDPGRDRFRAAQFAAEATPRPFVAVGELGVVPGPVPAIRSGSSSLSTGTVSAVNGVKQAWITGADGRVEDAQVPPGRLRVVARHPEYVPTTSAPIELAATARGEVVVTLSKGGTVEGVVEDDRGRPVEGAEVTLLAKDGSQERSATTGSDGSFAFAAVGSEVYLSVALQDDPSAAALREEVAVPDGAVKKVKLTVPGARDPLAIRVVDDRGYPLDAAEIILVSLDPKVPLRRTVFTNKQGEALARGFLGLPARAEIFALEHAPKVESVDGKKGDARFVLGLAESATALVRDRRGVSIADADVSLLTATGIKRERSDRDGEVTFRGLAPGSATLRIVAAGFAAKEMPVHIETQGGRRPTALPRIELAPGGEVTGEVRDSSGKPIAGARVAVGSVPVFIPSGPVPSGLAISDAKGHFRLTDVAAGTVVLEGYAPDRGRGRSAEFSIAAGQTVANVVVTLKTDEGGAAAEIAGGGGVAVTLGETGANEVVVVAVAAGSDAERAGLLAGDEITRVDGVAVAGMGEARARLSGPVGVDVVVSLRRNDAPLTLRIPRQVVRK